MPEIIEENGKNTEKCDKLAKLLQIKYFVWHRPQKVVFLRCCQKDQKGLKNGFFGSKNSESENQSFNRWLLYYFNKCG